MQTRGAAVFAHHSGYSVPMSEFPLSRHWRVLQDGFVVWVLLAAVAGYAYAEQAAAGKELIAPLLALVMLGMGLTVGREDIQRLTAAGRPLLLGVCLQFLVMPLAAWLLVQIFSLPKELAIGLILVGAAPGGTASNVVAYLARGDVALSVAMTTLSTLLAPLFTPLWVWWLAASWLDISLSALLLSVLQLVLLPVLLGMTIRRFWQPSRWLMQGMLPLLSMLAIAMIVAIVVGLNASRLASLSLTVLCCVVLLNLAGLWLGHVGAGWCGLDRRCRRTVAIEVGMQNSGLAVALAALHFSPLAALPGAVFSIWHNISGSLLASYWRRDREAKS